MPFSVASPGCKMSGKVNFIEGICKSAYVILKQGNGASPAQSPSPYVKCQGSTPTTNLQTPERTAPNLYKRNEDVIDSSWVPSQKGPRLKIMD